MKYEVKKSSGSVIVEESGQKRGLSLYEGQLYQENPAGPISLRIR